jgi:hypothetical protein
MQIVGEAAQNPHVDVEKMQQLLDMRDRVDATEAEKAFWKAFPAMQGELPEIPKNGVMRQQNRDKTQSWEIAFARFEDVIEHIKPVLKEHGFSLSFRHQSLEGGGIRTTGILAHEAGHREVDEFDAGADNSGSKNTIQANGSTRSYGKRYTTSSLLGLAFGGEDDDGANSQSYQSTTTSTSRSAPTSNNSNATKITKKQVGLLWAQLKNAGKDFEDLKERFEVDEMEEITIAQINDVLDWIKS